MQCSGCATLIDDNAHFCPNCGAKKADAHTVSGSGAAAQPSPSDASETPTFYTPDPDLVGVRGWLAWFCFVLMALQPAINFFEVFQSPELLTAMFAIGLSALSFTTGAMILMARPSAFTWIKWYFGVLIVVFGLTLVGSLMGEGTANDDIVQSIRGLVFVVVWVLYFVKSERVYATFGKNLFQKQAG